MATCFAAGRKNYLRFELFGSKGSLVLDAMQEAVDGKTWIDVPD